MKAYIGETISAPSEEYMERVEGAWKKYVETGVLDRDAVRPIIAASWERCVSRGVDPFELDVFREVSDEECRQRMAKSYDLLETARPFLANLYRSLSEVGL